MILRGPLIQRRRDQHRRVRLERLVPFVHTRTGLHETLNKGGSAERFIKQAALGNRYPYPRFFQPPAPQPGNFPAVLPPANA